MGKLTRLLVLPLGPTAPGIDYVAPSSLGTGVSNALAAPVNTASGVSVLDGTGKIASSTLPDVLTVGSIAFGDGSAVTLPTGTITGGSDTLLYRHNNTDTGGIPYAPQPRNTLKKVVSVPARRINGEVVNGITAGNITATGNLNTTFTSAATGVLTIPVAVVIGDTSYAWNRKVTAAWNANTTFAASYTAYSSAGLIQVQDKTANRVDATLSFTLANSTATGITNTTGSKSVQAAFIELGDFTIPASEAVANNKFFLTGEVSLISTGTNVVTNLELWGDISEAIATNLSNRISITAGAGGVNNNHLRFKAPILLSSGLFAMSSSAIGSPSFITETVINGTAIQSVTNRSADFPVGNSTKILYGVKGKAVLILTCAIQLTATSTAQVGIDLQLTNGGW